MRLVNLRKGIGTPNQWNGQDCSSFNLKDWLILSAKLKFFQWLPPWFWLNLSGSNMLLKKLELYFNSCKALFTFFSYPSLLAYGMSLLTALTSLNQEILKSMNIPHTSCLFHFCLKVKVKVTWLQVKTQCAS